MKRKNLLHHKVLSCLLAICTLLLSLGCSFSAAQPLNHDVAPLAQLKSPYTFVVLGDNRGGHGVYGQIVKTVAKLNPALVVNTGDMITNAGDRKEWENFIGLSQDLKMPYLLTVGNHDIYREDSQNIFKEYFKLPGNGLYYYFSVSDYLFIILDSELPEEHGKIKNEQMEWLQSVLKNQKAAHIFVFIHRPLYPDPEIGRHFGNSLDMSWVRRDELQRLFVQYKVDAVFVGHEHLYMKKQKDGIWHIITGGGGAPLYAGEKDGGFFHFLLVKVDGPKVTVKVYKPDLTLMDEFSWEKKP
jgi:3',5'-cyclic AMP phosphodiesterase CpdA